jgi:signal transduction histidine kinase
MSPHRIARTFRSYVTFAASVVCGIALLAILGQLLDIQPLKSVFSGMVTMKVNTALGLVLSGLALFASRDEDSVRSNRWRVALCLPVIALGLVTLAQYLFGWNAGIDELLMKDRDELVDVGAPGRMSVLTALCFVSLGSAFLLLNSKSRILAWPPQYLALFAWFVSLTGLVAYAFGLREYVGIFRTAMAVHTAIAVSFLATGILASRPHSGLLTVVTSRTSGGLLARWLLVPAIMLPLVIGWLAVLGAQSGAYPSHLTGAVAAVLHILLFSILVGFSAFTLYQGELRQREAETDNERLQVARLAEAGQRETLRFLNEANEGLAHSLDLQRTLERLSRLCLSKLARGCLAEVFNDSGDGECVAVAHVDSRIAERVESLFGAPVTCNRMDADSRERALKNALHLFGEKYAEVFPMTTTGRPLGRLTLVPPEEGRPFTSSERALAQELARRGASALERARLFQRANEAARTREEVLAVVSHDLRNPLGALRLSLELVSRSLPDSDATARARKQLPTMRRSIERMDRLIQDLLDFGRVGAGKLTVDPLPHEARVLIEDAVTLLEPLSVEKGQILEYRMPETGLNVLCERERVYQVFSNLVGNAIKFTPKGGRIRVSAEPRDEFIRFSISDTGPGISPELVKNLFDPFFQAQGASAREGAGLGLYIAKGIVESHGGRIWVDTAIGQGTTFYFTLPRAASTEVSAPDDGLLM